MNENRCGQLNEFIKILILKVFELLCTQCTPDKANTFQILGVVFLKYATFILTKTFFFTNFIQFNKDQSSFSSVGRQSLPLVKLFD